MNDEILDDPQEIAESLNNQFYKNFNKQSSNLHTLMLDNSVNPDISKLHNVNIDFSTVRDVIRSLPNKRSQDHDGFSYAILKGGGDILSLQLVRLFLLTFKCETIPNDWRTSVIIPLKKKSTGIDIENFRPINITSCICRILERIVRNAIYRQLIGNNQINLSQHGFLKGRSTTTALLSYTNDIVKSVDKNCV